MVGPDSDGIPRAPPYSGGAPEGHSLSLTGLSPSAAGFPNAIQLKNAFLTSPDGCSRPSALPLPPAHNACRLACDGFRLRPFRSPLLRASLSISFPPATEMFHFAGSPPDLPAAGLLPQGSPIRTPADRRMLAPTRGFSQLAASFFGVWLLRHPPRALNTLTSYIPYITLRLVMVPGTHTKRKQNAQSV